MRLFRPWIGQQLSGNGVIGVRGKGHGAFGNPACDGESAALGDLPAERREPPKGLNARGEAPEGEQTNGDLIQHGPFPDSN